MYQKSAQHKVVKYVDQKTFNKVLQKNNYDSYQPGKI